MAYLGVRYGPLEHESSIMRSLWLLLVPISTIGCYTALRPPGPDVDDDVETLRVEHHFADPYGAFGRWSYFPYGYGAARAFYLYDPYYDYYYGDPWWYLPDVEDDDPPPPRGPVVGTRRSRILLSACTRNAGDLRGCRGVWIGFCTGIDRSARPRRSASAPGV